MKQSLKRALPWVGVLAVFVALAALRALDASFDASYEIMNGDFQNYNPVRHLLAGQAPYGDFVVYLGAGELYSVGALLLVLGNTFGASVFAANFCTWFYFEVLVLAVCCVVMGTARAARAAALALAAYGYLVVCDLPVPLSGVMRPLLEYAAANGNSARMIRSAPLALAVLLSLAGLWLWRRGRQAGAKRLPPPWAFIPFVAGALVPWSNDMGAAMYLAVALGYGLFLLRLYRKNIKTVFVRVVQYILFSCVGLGVSVLAISRFHPIAWLRQARGTSAFQSWYYGTTADARLCYLGEYAVQPAGLFCLALAVAFAVGVFASRRDRSAALAAGGFALCLGMPVWNFAYCVLSGVQAGGPTGGATALLAVMLPALALRGVMLGVCALRTPRALSRVAPAVCGAFACVVFALGAYGQWQARQDGHGGLTYVESLGGWFGDQAEKLAVEYEMNQGKVLFGTYSSGLEAMTGQLQPTGVDYIIHAMGDRQRLDYLTTFQAGAFDRVVTPSPKVANSERWSRNANWWFYRELYRWWAPVANTYNSGGMHLFWERTGACNDLAQPCQVAVAQSGNQVTITVTAADPDFCGVADVTLDYSFALDPGFALRGGVHGFLHCTAVTENQLCAAAGRDTGMGDFCLPTDRGVYQVPVTVSDGVGVITLTALPADAASVSVNGAVVEATYFDWEYFFE